MRPAGLLHVVALGAALALVQPGGALAAPTIALDRAEAVPGDRLVVTLNGWAAQAVTVSVCGNLAKRGSPDCDLLGSEGVALVPGGPTVVELAASLPPAPCPCVVRAASTTQNQLATAPLVLTGAPVGPVVEPAGTGPLVAVSIAARKAPSGLGDGVRSSLGGRTVYDVAISVRNVGSATLSKVSLAGAVGRSRSEAASFAVPPPGPLLPGQTKELVVRATLPAPALGRFVWQVTASGAGPPLHAEVTTRVVPRGLVALSLVLLVDMAAMAWRRLARRRLRDSSSRRWEVAAADAAVAV